jgi:hypothetical protein
MLAPPVMRLENGLCRLVQLDRIKPSIQLLYVTALTPLSLRRLFPARLGNSELD